MTYFIANNKISFTLIIIGFCGVFIFGGNLTADTGICSVILLIYNLVFDELIMADVGRGDGS